MLAHWLYLAVVLRLGLSSQIGDGESTMVNVFKHLPQAKCDMIIVSPVPFKGEIAAVNNVRVFIVFEILEMALIIEGDDIGRSYIYFANLELLHSTWNRAELIHQVSSMQCLIALIMSDSFTEAMQFVDFISDLKWNPAKNKKKHLILNTPNIDQELLQNKTNNINVHVISQAKGMYTSSLVSSIGHLS